MNPGRAAIGAVALVTLALGPAQTAPRHSALPPSFWPPPVLSRERAITETVRVESRGQGAFDTGTGISVGAHVVLTNAHLTRDNVMLVTRCASDLLATDRIEQAPGGDDVAVLVTSGAALLPAEIASQDPAPGSQVLIAGYPQGNLTLVDGTVDGLLVRDGTTVLRFSPEPQVGQSGSALLDANGRIVGLAFARDDAGGQGLAVPASRLRTLLDGFRASGVPVAAAATGDPAAAPARSSVCG
ncbi:MAG TPA: serine protease [Acidimicrobiales bacterium]|nr:serine protease [Acidimicrobiales bacterium]